MHADFTHHVDISAPPEQVSAALTTAAGIRGWWSVDCDVEERVGGRHELRFDKGGRTVVMRFVVDSVAPDRVAWTCTENGNPVWVDTQLEWALSPGDEGTRVAFSHRGLGMPGSPPYKMTVDTWPSFLASLKAYVETGTGAPW